jgi:hypothetical protein
MNALHYALVLGIDRYPEITDLNGAKADASAFADWLRKPEGGGLPSENVHLLNRTAADERRYRTAKSAEPRQDDIDDALLAIVDSISPRLRADRSAWGRSRLYLYVAGHGCAPAGSEGAFLLANAGPRRYTRNIDIAKYREWMSACAWFGEIAIFADCCRTRVKAGPAGSGPRLDGCPVPAVDGEPVWVVGYAAEKGRTSYEDRDGQDDDARGHFTRALIDGLDGSAADDAGAVTAVSLGDYVKAIVADTTRNKRYQQIARFPLDAPASFVFGSASAAPARVTWPVTIAFPAGFAGSVVVRFNRDEVAAHVAFANDGMFKVAGQARNVQL